MTGKRIAHDLVAFGKSGEQTSPAISAPGYLCENEGGNIDAPNSSRCVAHGPCDTGCGVGEARAGCPPIVSNNCKLDGGGSGFGAPAGDTQD
jgi:hypothetical protein